jgi:hypothetical protein
MGVSFVVVGSAAARMHGVDLEPGDLDIVPDLESANLLRLVAALKSLEASVNDIDRVGHWLIGEGGEWSWTSRAATDAERGALLAGELRVDDIDSLDHHFLTKHGNLDVVPRVAGEYSELVARARTVAVEATESPSRSRR